MLRTLHEQAVALQNPPRSLDELLETLTAKRLVRTVAEVRRVLDRRLHSQDLIPHHFRHCGTHFRKCGSRWEPSGSAQPTVGSRGSVISTEVNDAVRRGHGADANRRARPLPEGWEGALPNLSIRRDLPARWRATHIRNIGLTTSN